MVVIVPFTCNLSKLKLVSISLIWETMQPVSVREIPEGMEVSEWGGVDHATQFRCRHRKRPRRMLCWDSTYCI
jgi:hypothetical protein